MGRPNKRDRQAARAREQVQASLARERAADAASALLTLPREDRSFALPALAAAAQPEIERAYAQRSQTELVSWLAHIEREPRLWSLLDAPARYALFSAAVRGRMWPRAQKLWPDIRPCIDTHPLCEAIGALVANAGSLPPGSARQVLDSEIRLGYDLPRPRVEHPVPQTLPQLEAACLRCFGCEPWSSFQEVVTRWLQSVPTDLAGPLRLLSAQLSERELLCRAQDNPGAALKVARFIIGCVGDAGSPAELEDLVELCMRVAARAASDAADNSRACEILLAAAHVAWRYPRLREMVAQAVLEARLETAQAPVARDLLRLALTSDPNPRAVIAAAVELHVLELHAPEHGGTPDWFEDAVSAALGDPQAFARALQECSETSPWRERSECAEPCHALIEALSVEGALRAVDAVWADASEALRASLSGVCHLLLERIQRPPEPVLTDLAPLGSFAAGGEARSDRARSEALRSIVRALAAGWNESAEYDPAYEGDARKFLERAAAYDPGCLERAIERAESKAETLRLARRHLQRAKTLCERLALLGKALAAQCPGALSALETSFLDDISPDALDTAKTLLLLERSQAPRRLRNRLSRLLIALLTHEPAALDAAEVAQAAAIARRRVTRRTRPAQARDALPAPGTKRKRRVTTREAAEAQLELGGDKEKLRAQR